MRRLLVAIWVIPLAFAFASAGQHEEQLPRVDSIRQHRRAIEGLSTPQLKEAVERLLLEEQIFRLQREAEKRELEWEREKEEIREEERERKRER